MGIWSLPFDNESKAKKFEKNMAAPWIAKVVKDNGGDYRWSAKDLSFGGGIYGDDSLWDYLGETSEKKKKDFDIRPYVIECLKYQLWHCQIQPDSLYSEKALQRVRKSIGWKETDGIRLRELANTTLDLLEKNKVVLDYAVVYSKDKKLSWTTENISIFVPRKFLKNKSVHVLVGRCALKKIPKSAYKDITNIEKVVVESKSFGNSKSIVYVFFNLEKSPIEKAAEVKKWPARKKSVRLHLKKGKSDKVWKAKIEKNIVHIEFGRRGSQLRQQIKKFASEQLAQSFLDTKIQEKQKKGYL